MTIWTKTRSRYHVRGVVDNHDYTFGKCQTCGAPIITSVDGASKNYCFSCEASEQKRILQNITLEAQAEYFEAVEIEPWNEIPDELDGTEPSPYVYGGEIFYPAAGKSNTTDDDMPF